MALRQSWGWPVTQAMRSTSNSPRYVTLYFLEVDRFTKTYILLERRLFNLSLEKPFDLFDKVVVPELLYGCEIWCYKNIEFIEKNPFDFLR